MRILAGPDNWAFFTEYWRKGLCDHDLMVFSESQGDIQFHPSKSTFQDILVQLPTGWEPELVIWWFPEFQPVLPGLVDCPYPTMAQISDWHTVTDAMFPLVSQFDLVATDRCGVRLLKKVSGPTVFEAPLYGFDPDHHKLLPDCDRVFDVTHVGDLHPLIHQQRVSTLARAATGLHSEFAVRYCSGVYGEDYTRLLNQSRITINYAVRGEMSMRCYEAPACGSLLFCEEGNESARDYLQDKRHCIYYNQDNLVDLLRYYLDHEEERAALAQAGYKHIQQFTYRRQGQRLIEQARVLLLQRPATPRTNHSLANYWCALSTPRLPMLAYQQTHDALVGAPHDLEIRNQRGCIEAQIGDKISGDQRFDFFEDAIANLSQVLALGLMAHLSLARALLRSYRQEQATEVLLRAVDQPFRDVTFFPRSLAALHVLWEREPENRQATARWQLYELLSQLIPDRAVEYCRLALGQRPDMATTWFRLALRLKPGSPERHDALQKAHQGAPSFAPALFKLAQEYSQRGHSLSLAFPNFPYDKEVSKINPPRSLEDFMLGISFDWLQPMQPVSEHLVDREGSELEYYNTYFAHEDAVIKRRFHQLESVPRMSTLAISAILQRIVADMPADQAFVNVGVWHGFSFLASLLDNPDKLCIGIDNFSQFGGPKREFLERFERLRGPAHQFHEMDYQDYFRQHHSGLLGAYLYDGEHSYANQLQGLKVAEPYFAKGCLVLVDDTNWDEPRQASLDFIQQSSRRYELLLDVRTAGNGHPTWWNGFMVCRCLE